MVCQLQCCSGFIFQHTTACSLCDTQSSKIAYITQCSKIANTLHKYIQNTNKYKKE